MPDFIPSNHEEFQSKLSQYETWLVANGAALGFSPAEIADVTTAKSAVQTKLAAKKTADTTVSMANSELQTSETDATGLWRSGAKRLQVHPAMTDAMRIAAGLTVPTGTRTARTVGTEVPALHVEPGIGQLTIHWGTTPTNEHSNGKPAWADGANIYVAINNGPETLAGFDRSSPFVHPVSGPPVSLTIRAAYRGPKDDQIGGKSPPVTVSTGG